MFSVRCSMFDVPFPLPTEDPNTKTKMKTKLTFALVASLTSTAFAEFKAPLPEFKNEKQLAEWRAEQTAKSSTQSTATQETTFYTGKPYVESSGNYAFKYRSFSPELARWTSEDPSGFPDGANNHTYSCNTPVNGLDADGLLFLCYNGGVVTAWSGAGKQSDGKIDWGTKTGDHWGAVSGGAGTPAKPSIVKGWWQVGTRFSADHMGGPDDVVAAGEISEQDWKVGNVWHEGAMSVWKSDNRADGHTQYKYALNPLDGQNGDGIKLHPDGPVIGVTHGCIGISGYDGAVSIDSYLQGHSGIKLYVE